MSQSLTDDLYEQVEQLERSVRRWRLVALAAMVGLFLALLLAGTSLGLWFADPRHRNDHWIDVQTQLNLERSQHEAERQQMHTQMEQLERELSATKRTLEEAKKDAAAPKAP